MKVVGTRQKYNVTVKPHYRIPFVPDEGAVLNKNRLCIAKGCSIETIDVLRNYLLKVQSVDILDLCYAAANVKEVGEQYYRGVRWENPARRERLFERLSQMYSANELRGSIRARWKDVGNRMSRDDSRHMIIALLATDSLTSHVTSRSLREG